MKLLGRYWHVRFRTENAVRDWWDRHIRRLCCQPPKPGQGGYRWWRCGLPHDHDGPHRFANYVWTDSEMAGGGVRYDPIHHSLPNPARPMRRRVVG